MLANSKKPPDEPLEEILHVLAPYGASHGQASLEAHREDAFSVFVRIIDPDFKGMEDFDRLEVIRTYLKPLSLIAWNHLGTVLLLTPAEARKSLENQDFENLKASKKVIRPGKLNLPKDEAERSSPQSKQKVPSKTQTEKPKTGVRG